MSVVMDTVISASDKRQFTIRACLGRGGFGEVYRASMTNTTGLEADVAIKVLHNDLDVDSQAVQRLRDEGRMLGALVHPSIVRVYDLVILEGRVGLVTEYVEGADLADCLRGDDPMPPRAVAAAIGRVADALHAAWVTPAPGSDNELNLIHRDVKPANIRIGVQGAVKLLDFGVARSSRVNREAHTNTGHMVGSYLYMAPECLTENTFSGESDAFALGATMFEALAGERLFPSQSLRELYVLVLKDDAYDTYIEERLATIDVPKDMASLLRRMLARDASERATAKDISAACEDLVDGMKGPTLRRWCKERDWPIIQIIPGMLDGRTITEATMAARLRPDFAVAPPTKRKPFQWGTWIAGVGTVTMFVSLLVAAVAAVLLTIAIMGRSTGGGRVIQLAPAPQIPAHNPGPTTEPNRTETGVSKKARANNERASSLLKIEVRPNNAGRGRLRQDGESFGSATRIPYGRYTLQVDFGDGYKTMQRVHVRSSKTTFICTAYLRSCTQQ